MLRPLEDEVPAKMRKADQRLSATRTRSEMGWNWRSTFGARSPLTVQRRIPQKKPIHEAYWTNEDAPQRFRATASRTRVFSVLKCETEL
jgi:hypothetical protein